MLLSIIVPTFNAAKHLDKLLRLVFDLPQDLVETIFVDDCSKDDSAFLISQFIEKKPSCGIKLYQQELNQGAAAARNLGVEISTGEYIFFCDSDDEFNLSELEHLFPTLLTHKYDMVLFDMLICYNTKKEESVFVKTDQRIEYTKSELVSLISSFRVSPCTRIVKKSIISAIPFSTALKVAEDLDGTPRQFTLAQNALYVPALIYYYNVGHVSLSDKAVSQPHLIFEAFTSLLDQTKVTYHEEYQKICAKQILYWIPRTMVYKFHVAKASSFLGEGIRFLKKQDVKIGNIFAKPNEPIRRTLVNMMQAALRYKAFRYLFLILLNRKRFFQKQ